MCVMMTGERERKIRKEVIADGSGGRSNGKRKKVVGGDRGSRGRQDRRSRFLVVSGWVVEEGEGIRRGGKRKKVGGGGGNSSTGANFHSLIFTTDSVL